MFRATASRHPSRDCTLFDFGFVPSTLAEDGDPLDVMVLMDAPAHVGWLIEIKLLKQGMSAFNDNGTRNS
jgi:inorganic pyrophosphatase